MGIIPNIGVTTHKAYFKDGRDAYEYDGTYYENYDYIRFFSNKAYEVGSELVQGTVETILDKPGVGHLLKGAAWTLGKGFQYIDKEAGGAYSTLLGLADTGMTKAADAVEYHTGLYSPTAKLGGELAIDYALSGGVGKTVKTAKRLASQADNLLATTAKTIFPQPQYAYATVLSDNHLLKNVLEEGLSSSSSTFKPSTFFTATTARTSLASNIPYESTPLFEGRASRTAGGYQGKGTSGLSSSYIKKGGPFAKLFEKLKKLQVEGPWKHHHVLDEAFAGRVLNTSDYKEVLQELNQMKIYPGNSPKNIIGMMDEKTFGFMKGPKDNVILQLKNSGYPGFENITSYNDLLKKGNESQRRLLDDLFKNVGMKDVPLQKGTRHPLTGEITLPEIRRVELDFPRGKSIDWKGSFGLDTDSSAFKALSKTDQNAAKQSAWNNRFKRLNIDKSQFKYDPSQMILSKDHIDIVHRSVYESPKFKQRTELLNMVADGSYYKLTPKQKAEKIAEVYRIQRNVSVNTAKMRLKTIKNYIKGNVAPAQADLLLRDPKLLRNWIIENRGLTSRLDWGEGIPSYSKLTRDPGNISDEFRTIFSTEIK